MDESNCVLISHVLFDAGDVAENVEAEIAFRQAIRASDLNIGLIRWRGDEDQGDEPYSEPYIVKEYHIIGYMSALKRFAEAHEVLMMSASFYGSLLEAAELLMERRMEDEGEAE